jgi:N-acetylmuramoyl-L-alanine amidase
MRLAWIPAFAGMTLALSAASKEVAVDVGHYAAEPGVISASGVPEFEYNLALALEVKADLEKKHLKVRLIGERGDYAVLHHRTRDAQGADLFVSIHHDSVKEELLPQADQFSGFSLFVSKLNPRVEHSLACASAIGARLRAAGFTPSRYHADPVTGAPRPFADEANGVHWYDNLAVGRTALMPSVLVEAGVIVNREEDKRMRDPQVRARIAAAVAQGVQKCLE